MGTAARHGVSLEAARVVLLEAVERLSNAASVHYALACCECQLGQFAVAKGRLKFAFKLDPDLRAKALDDEDLAALW